MYFNTGGDTQMVLFLYKHGYFAVFLHIKQLFSSINYPVLMRVAVLLYLYESKFDRKVLIYYLRTIRFGALSLK